MTNSMMSFDDFKQFHLWTADFNNNCFTSHDFNDLKVELIILNDLNDFFMLNF